MEYLVYIAHSPFHDPSYIHSAFYFPFSFPRLGTLDMHGLVLYVYTFNPDTYTCCLFIFICSSIGVLLIGIGLFSVINVIRLFYRIY